MDKTEALTLSPLALAFVGDAVFELFIRTKLAVSRKRVGDLHKESVKFVKASAQADILRNLEKFLTQEEIDIVRNARNTKVNSIPKNADIADYHYSTGYEALLGFLYLTGERERLDTILMASYELGLIENTTE